MISKLYKKLVQYLDESISFYSHKRDKTHLFVGFMMLVMGLLALLYVGKDNGEKSDEFVFIYYVIVFFIMLGLYILTLYWTSNPSKKYLVFKKIILIIIIPLFNLTILPITIYMFITHRSKFDNLYKYYDIYMLGLLITFFLDLVTYVILNFYFIQENWINTEILSLFITFILSGIFMKGTVWTYFKIAFRRIKNKYKKSKITEQIYNEHLQNKKEDYQQFKNELYILNFILIALGTAVIYLLKWEIIMPDVKNIKSLNENILYAFSLYAAFDTVVGKWREKNIK